MRHFADAARIPASPPWQIAVETEGHTVAEWRRLEPTSLLATDMRASIEKQIHTVAGAVKRRRFWGKIIRPLTTADANHPGYR
jgi:hypothetical protein